MSTDRTDSSKGSIAAAEKNRVFPPTRWTELKGMKGRIDAEKAHALEFLAREYWKPIFCFVTSLGVKEQDAKDLVQGFFLFAIERDLFSQADPEQGKFRNFLCASVKHFVFNEWRGAKARKRFPAGGLVTIYDSNQSDGIAFHAQEQRTPEEAFDRAWMEGIIERAAGEMAQEYRGKAMEIHYAVFEERFLKPLLRVAQASSYAELNKRFGITAKKIDTCLITARRRFRSLVRAEIQKYAKSEAAVRDELNLLFELAAND
jgi:DNA-directed RNA polymerase specialized sigma24 family protein